MKLPALREIIEERKEKAIETLSTSYAKNRMPLEEYERLVEYINKIESERELVVVEKIVAEYSEAEAPDTSADTAGAEASRYEDDDEDEVFHPRYHSGGNLTIFSSRTFHGPVKSGSELISIFGSCRMKVKKADLRKHRTNLEAVAVFGECSIYVEPGIRVINKVTPILGNAGVSNKVEKLTRNGDPEIVITGAAVFGDISVKLLKD